MARKDPTKCEDAEYAAFASRIIRGLAKRASSGDVEVVRLLGELRGELDAALHASVVNAMSAPTPPSWSQVGQALGVTRQAAMQRFPGVKSQRQVGGQPAHLR